MGNKERNLKTFLIFYLTQSSAKSDQDKKYGLLLDSTPHHFFFAPGDLFMTSSKRNFPIENYLEGMNFMSRDKSILFSCVSRNSFFFFFLFSFSFFFSSSTPQELLSKPTNKKKHHLVCLVLFSFMALGKVPGPADSKCLS